MPQAAHKTRLEQHLKQHIALTLTETAKPIYQSFARQSENGGSIRVLPIKPSPRSSATLRTKSCRLIIRATAKRTSRFGDRQAANGLFCARKIQAFTPFRSEPPATFPRRLIMTRTEKPIRQSFVRLPEHGLSVNRRAEPTSFLSVNRAM